MIFARFPLPMHVKLDNKTIFAKVWWPWSQMCWVSMLLYIAKYYFLCICSIRMRYTNTICLINFLSESCWGLGLRNFICYVAYKLMDRPLSTHIFQSLLFYFFHIPFISEFWINRNFTEGMIGKQFDGPN